MRSRTQVAGVLVAGVVLALLVAPAGAQEQTETRTFLLNGQGNRLAMYGDLGAEDPAGVDTQILIPNAEEGGRDLNAQICFDPQDPRHFIAGEDTNQDADRPAGWGYFELTGGELGSFGWEQVGKLTPTYQEHRVSGHENYGCGFLPDGRLLTSDVGDQYPPLPGNGQLIMWFPPFDRGDVLLDDASDDDEQVSYCKIDVSVDTAGGIYVDGDDVYVASNRVGADTDPGGIFRYSGDWPTSDDPAGGCGRTDETGAPLVDEGRVTKEVFIPADQHVMTPSAIWPSGEGTFYVSSVFTGVIAEYGEDGAFVREIMRPPPTEQPPYPSTGTPYGLITDDAGTIYYADLGIVTGPPPQPEPGAGSVRRIRFEGGEPLAPEILDEGLDFPDGVGLFQLEVAATGGTSAGDGAASDGTAGAPADDAQAGAALPATGGGLALLATLVLGAALTLRRPSR